MRFLTKIIWTILSLGLLTGVAQAQPTWQWATKAGPASNVNDDSYVVAAVADGAGGTIVAGSFSGTLTLGPTTLVSAGSYDAFVARLSSTGQWLQAVRAGGTADEKLNDIAVDAAGTVVAVGNFGDAGGTGSTTTTAIFGTTTLTSIGRSDTFIARLNSAGIWTQAVSVGAPMQAVEAATVAIDGAGNVVVAGGFAGSPIFGTTTLTNGRNSQGGSSQDVFVARLNAAGQWTQAVQAQGPIAATYAIVSDLALDAAGNAVLTGFFENTVRFGTTAPLISTGGDDLFVVRLSPTGQWLQAVRAGGGYSDSGNHLAVDGAGNIFVAGQINSTSASGAASGAVNFGNITLSNTNLFDVFVAKLSSAGIWTQAAQAGGSRYDTIGSLVLDGAGNAVVTGVFGLDFISFSSGGTAQFGNTTLTCTGQANMFVSQLGPTGQWGRVLQVASTLSVGGSALVMHPNGDFVVAGIFDGNAAFGAITLTSAAPAVFVARLAGFVAAAAAATPATHFTLTPNPATTFTHLNWPKATASPSFIQLLDGLGREVRRQILPAHTAATTVDVTGLAPGLYVVRCEGAAAKLRVE